MAEMNLVLHFRIPAKWKRLNTGNHLGHGSIAELSLTGVGCGLQTRRSREAQRFNSSWSASHAFPDIHWYLLRFLPNLIP